MTVTVSNIMRKQVISIDSSLTVRDAAKMMEDTSVGCLVVTEKNIPVGILTERDFVTRIASIEKPSSTSVKQAMSLPLISIGPGETITKLAELMKEKKIHKVPVIKENQLVGIVTATDLIRKCIIDSDSGMREMCRSFAQMAF